MVRYFFHTACHFIYWLGSCNVVCDVWQRCSEIVLFRAPCLHTTQEPSQLKFEGEVTLYKLRSWIAEH